MKRNAFLTDLKPFSMRMSLVDRARLNDLCYADESQMTGKIRDLILSANKNPIKGETAVSAPTGRMEDQCRLFLLGKVVRNKLDDLCGKNKRMKAEVIRTLIKNEHSRRFK